jgi:ADP-dependent phosphofructokinase/glucokinase
MHGALELCRVLDLKRLHVHTFGYYILIIRGDTVDAGRSRNALLYAAREVATAAGGTGTGISADGISAVMMAEQSFGPPVSPGIFKEDSCWILVVPTLIARGITKSSGLGDILSSTAFVADEFG